MEHFGDGTAIKLDNEQLINCNNVQSFGSGDTHITNNFLSNEEANEAFDNLFSGEIEYQQWHHMPSKKNELLPLSRLKIATANTDSDGWTPHYRFPVNNQDYHGVQPVSKTVQKILDKLIDHTKIQFNHAVVLLYRDGNDCIGFHKDKTLDLSPTGPIASISIGQERTYILRNSIHNPTISQEVTLKHGTLLLLGPKTNEEYYHSIPKLDNNIKTDPCISLTFRVVTTFKHTITGELRGHGAKYTNYNWPTEFSGLHIPYPHEILDFWFGKEKNQFRSGLWWNGIHPTEKNLRTKPQVDEYITSKYKNLLDKYDDVNQNINLFEDNHYLKSWMCSTDGIVALLILFDQFPRHIYRGILKSFSFDKYALEIVDHLKNNITNICLPYKLFIYVAMMHAENIPLVTDATYEIYKLANSNNLPDTGNNASSMWKNGLIKLGNASQEHLDILKKFGRYAHRNHILGRVNTTEENDYFFTSKKIPYWMKSVLGKSDPVKSVLGKTDSVKLILPKTDKTDFILKQKLKILVLHSNRQTSDIFRSKTERHLEKKIRDIADLTYCNSPQLYTPMGEVKRLIEEHGYTNVPNIGHTRIWWNATDDPNTMVYIGLEQSLEYIESLFKNEQYDGIIGFSQGGTFTGIIASMVHDQRKGKKTFMPLDNISKSLKFVTIISGFYCRDTRPEFKNCLLDSLPTAHLPELVVMRKDLIEIPSFHTWGLTDTLVNPWRSEKLSEAFDKTKQIHIHQSSHFAQAIKYWPIDKLHEWLKTFVKNTDLTNNNTDLTNNDTHPINKDNKDISYDILQILYKTDENIYTELLKMVRDYPLFWKHLIDIDTANYNEKFRKILVSLIGDELINDYKKYCVNKSLGIPSKIALYAPKYNNVYRGNRLYHDMAFYVANHINIFDSTKKCINEEHQKRQLLLSYNQYRKIISRLTVLICPPHDKKEEKKHIPRNNLEQLLNVPVSEYILHPMPEPVVISPPELLKPLYDFLQNEKKSNTEKVFEKGTVCVDGRLDLCKQVIGPIGVQNLIESLRLDSISEEPKVKHLLLGNNRCGNDLGNEIANFIKSGKSALTTWYIAGNNLDGDGISPVCEALHNDTQVKQLWLKRNPIYSSGILHITNMLKNNVYLKVLDLANTGLMDDGAKLLLTNLNSTLEYLYLASNGLTEKTCEIISDNSLVNLNNLKQIGLGCNRLKNDGMKYLALALKHPNCRLESLEIASCGVGPIGAKYIADALKINTLIVHLNFGFLKSTNDLGEVPNFLESQGAIDIADMLTINKTLRSLDMIYTAIKQSGILALANAVSEKNTTLAYLNIEQFGVPHNELSREIVRKTLQKNKENIGPILIKQIDDIILPPHLDEIKSVYRIK